MLNVTLQDDELGLALSLSLLYNDVSLTANQKENAMTAKTVNYTPEMTAKLVEGYKAAPTMETVSAFAVEFGKTAKSVIAKLSKEGVYQKKEYTGKTGEKPVKKDSLADQIGMLLGLSEADTDSLAKANKSALAKVLEAVKVETLSDANDVS